MFKRCKRYKLKCLVSKHFVIIIFFYTIYFIIYLYIRYQLCIPPFPGVFKNVIKVDGRKMIFPCKNPVFISWNKLKFSPCKNLVIDPWSNRRQSPRQHVNYHGIVTGHSCEITQIILCSSRVFVCWDDNDSILVLTYFLASLY